MIIFIGHSESGATTWRRNRSVLSYQGPGLMERDWLQRDERILESDGRVLYLYCGGDYMMFAYINV